MGHCRRVRLRDSCSCCRRDLFDEEFHRRPKHEYGKCELNRSAKHFKCECRRKQHRRELRFRKRHAPHNQAGLAGKWTGTYGPSNNPATLVVKEYQDGRFSGILEQGQARVAVTGTVDLKSRRVKIKETQVLSGSGWSLGEDEGEISSDGRKMFRHGPGCHGRTVRNDIPMVIHEMR